MISLTDYTSYAEIRAALGVSSYELSDATLALPVYTRGLQTKLYAMTGAFGGVTGNLMDFFDALSGEASPTADEENFLSLIQQYATYIVADLCASSLSMFALKTETDGEAAQSRFSSEATFKDVVLGIRQQLASLSAQLDQALGGEISFVLPTLARVAPATDVVTNESA